ncbi:hypothetical protein Tco_1228942 [Tanacetum coccineum]
MSKEGSRQEAGRGQDFKPVRTEKEALMTIDEGQINWVEQTTDEELNHALMAFTVNNEVSMCSKLCLDSYNALQAKYDELQSEFGDQEAALTAHKLAVKKLESQLRASHKQQSSLTEKLNFQANQIFEKDEKLKKYRRIGMKAVKDKDALQKIVDSWFASSKNLWKLIDCGMSSTVKIGLGYGIQSNAEVLGYEEEISRGIFAFRETDAGNYDIPLYSRFKQMYGKYGPQPQSPSPTESDASSTVYSTCQSNDSVGKQELSLPRIRKLSSEAKGVHPNVAASHKPAWTNTNRVNKANQFTPRPVNGRPNLSTACKTIKTGTAVKTSTGCVWRKVIPLSNTNGGPTPDSNVNVSECTGRPKAWAHLERLLKLSKEGSVSFGEVKVVSMEKVLLKAPRPHKHVYFDMKKNVDSSKEYTLFISKSLINEAKLCNRRIANPAGSKEVIDIDVQTEEAADLMVKRAGLLLRALQALRPYPTAAPTSTNPVNTGSDNLNTGFEEVTPGNIEAISPCADHEEEVFSDADDDEMPEIRIFDKSSEDESQVKQNKEELISSDKYVAEILKKFALMNVKATITPMETKLPLTKDEEAFDVDVHLYRSMIGSLMYLTASRPDIMYAICVCSRFPSYHSKTTHIEILTTSSKIDMKNKAHNVEKIHTDLNVADCVDQKPFDGPQFNYLVVTMGRIEP